MASELENVAHLALERVARRGYDYTDRKIYTLAEFDWGSTYGYDEGYSKPNDTCATPGGIFMVQGSPCRGVLVVRQKWDGWLVNFVNDHIRCKFVVPFEEVAK